MRAARRVYCRLAREAQANGPYGGQWRATASGVAHLAVERVAAAALVDEHEVILDRLASP